MSQRFQKTCAAELECLQNYRDFISESCAQNNISDDIVLDLKLAVDEACTNIIVHGYKDMDPGSIIVSMRIDPDRILVQITDFGHVFEPVAGLKPDVEAALEDRELGGLGLYLIYQTMDDIDYQSSEEGNMLTFTKFIK